MKTVVFFDILIQNSMRGKEVTGERNERRDLAKGRTTYGNPVILHQVIRWTASERRIVGVSTHENVAVWL